MAMQNQRRSLLRLGALILVIAVALGLLTAIPLDPPGKWRAAHLSALLVGLLIVGYGLLWRDLRLTNGQRRAAFLMASTSAWFSLAFGIATALLDIPGPATNPGVQPEGIELPVMIALLIVIVPTTVGSAVLVWYGLRGKETE
jgi:hypothetical protein